MESNGFFHYRERVSLVQLAAPGRTFLVDPLAVHDLSALGRVLADPKVHKVLHGSDYDLRSFDREWGFRFAGLHDTAVATQLLNPELMGLGRALETYLHVKVTKQVRLQRSDWSRRPLPADAAEYAAADAAHLLALHDALTARLRELGREAWMAEECALLEGVRYEAPPPPEEACFSAKGSFDLPPEALAVFRELYLVRERSAERADRPPFKVISTEALLAVASDPAIPPERVPNANRRWLGEMQREIRAAVERGRRAGPLVHPSKLKRRPNPWTDDARARHRALQDARAAKARDLGIAPSTLWPTRSLEQAALHPELFEAELAGTSGFGVRLWQREILGESLRTAWAAAVQ